jgi:hypothetical protein
MTSKRNLFVILATLTAAVISTGGMLFVAHHALMMSSQSMPNSSSTAQVCVAQQDLTNVCDGVLAVIAPVAENLLLYLGQILLPALVLSLAVVLGQLLGSYLEPVLKRPLKLYLANSILRI